MTPSITQDDVTTALRSFLLSVLPSGVEVFIGQANRVPEPAADNFIVMTPNTRARLATTVAAWDQADANAEIMTWAESTQIDVQLDIHGAGGTDNAQVIQTLFRSAYAYDFMAASGVFPLYCDDGKQVPFINGEQQWEDRWIINAQLAATPIVSTPQQFAATLTAGLIDVDAAYPPGA
jgi:hypothetical protein